MGCPKGFDYPVYADSTNAARAAYWYEQAARQGRQSYWMKTTAIQSI